MKTCPCGGIFESGTCGDCGRSASILILPTAKQIIAVLKAHKRQGHDDILTEVITELGSFGLGVIVEKRVPVETRTIETIAKEKISVHGRGRPPQMSFDSIVRAKAMMANGFERSEVAKVLGVSDRTVEEYISLKGELKTPAIRRLQGEHKCTKVRRPKQ